MVNRDNRGGALTRRPQGTLLRSSGQGMLGFGNPWREMEEMHRRMDDLFARVFGFEMPDVGLQMQGWETSGMEPDVDVYENENEYIIHAALPGIDPNDIHVEATENSIHLKAESRSPFETQEQQGQQSSQGVSTGKQDGNAASPGGSTQTAMTQGGKQGEMQPHTQHRQSRYSRQSRFEFAYTLPEEIKSNDVRASFRNGRLELHLPKVKEAPSKGRSIPITIENGAYAASHIDTSATRQASGAGTWREGQPANTGSNQANTPPDSTLSQSHERRDESNPMTTDKSQNMNAEEGKSREGQTAASTQNTAPRS